MKLGGLLKTKRRFFACSGQTQANVSSLFFKVLIGLLYTGFQMWLNAI